MGYIRLEKSERRSRKAVDIDQKKQILEVAAAPVVVNEQADVVFSSEADADVANISPQIDPSKEVIDKGGGNKGVINKGVLETLVLSDNLIREMDRHISDYYDTRLIYKESSMSTLSECTGDVGILTVDDIKAGVLKYKEFMFPVGKLFLGGKDKQYSHISRGISILVLCYILVARERDPLFAKKFLKQHFLENGVSNSDMAARLISCYLDVDLGKEV